MRFASLGENPTFDRCQSLCSRHHSSIFFPTALTITIDHYRRFSRGRSPAPQIHHNSFSKGAAGGHWTGSGANCLRVNTLTVTGEESRLSHDDSRKPMITKD